MGKVNFNVKNAIEEIEAFQEKAEEIAYEKYQDGKEKFLDDFENHPVTQEIEGGASASNSSNTLNGIGNLFSYIGFYQNQNPISDLKKILNENFSFRRKSKNTFLIKYPDLEKIKSQTPMPWEGGRSWVLGIERGISGFGYYLYKKFNEGRSKEGIQTKNKVRSSSFKKVRYMSEIINNFVKSINK
jgi:hypothetical protein